MIDKNVFMTALKRLAHEQKTKTKTKGNCWFEKKREKKCKAPTSVEVEDARLNKGGAVN
jgi:hypothetical protein